VPASANHYCSAQLDASVDTAVEDVTTMLPAAFCDRYPACITSVVPRLRASAKRYAREDNGGVIVT